VAGISIDQCPNCGAPLSVNAYGRCSYCGAVIHGEAMVPAAPADAMSPEIIGLIRAGKKIQAIKAYRQLTGLGLAEAKDAVEAEESRLKAN
jgi:ribosomal protein L7/L12